MKCPYAINTIYLTISSSQHLLDQIKAGKTDGRTLQKHAELLTRLLCSIFIANFETEDEAIAILAEYCVTSVFPKLRHRFNEDQYSVTAAIKAAPRRRTDGRLGLAATDISAEHILSMYRHHKPEIILA